MCEIFFKIVMQVKFSRLDSAQSRCQVNIDASTSNIEGNHSRAPLTVQRPQDSTARDLRALAFMQRKSNDLVKRRTQDRRVLA